MEESILSTGWQDSQDHIRSGILPILFILSQGFSGVRIDEARHVLWSDVNFEKGLLHLRVTKNGKACWIQLNTSLRQSLENMRAERPEDSPDKPVMQVFECQKSIDRATKLAGVKRITHHDLRHLFATRSALAAFWPNFVQTLSQARFEVGCGVVAGRPKS